MQDIVLRLNRFVRLHNYYAFKINLHFDILLVSFWFEIFWNYSGITKTYLC